MGKNFQTSNKHFKGNNPLKNISNRKTIKISYSYINNIV